MRDPRSFQRSSRRPVSRLAQSGMTLIEIMVVIVLIGGILAVIGGTIFSNKDKANHKLAGIQIQKVAANIESYNSDVGEYPRTLEDLVTDPQIDGWLGPYGSDKDIQDPFNNALQYNVPGESADFDLVSYGKDKQPGGSSVDADIKYAQ